MHANVLCRHRRTLPRRWMLSVTWDIFDMIDKIRLHHDMTASLAARAQQTRVHLVN